LDRAVAAIEEMGAHRPTLVCCALGRSRSAAAVAAWLVATQRVSSVDRAISMIAQEREVVLTQAHRTQLLAWAHERRYV